jgi:nucleotide-binding universal stress UspA family protein
MLIGMDFSDVSIAAAKWASQSFAPTAEMMLAHVIELPDRPRFLHGMLPSLETIETSAREFGVTRLREVATYLMPGTARREVRVGKPAEEIVALVRETQADLVVIGPHDDRPRPSRFLGTTAERIVRSCHVPVLVAANPPAGTPRNMLVLVDDSAIAPTVLQRTRGLAEQFDAGVTLFHVLSNTVYSHIASMSYATEATEDDARREIQAELSRAGVHWLQELAGTGLARSRVTAAIGYGKAGDVAIEMAKTMHADLMVLGRRGSGLVAPALLGSTLGTVLDGARCPVLVITERGQSPRL